MPNKKQKLAIIDGNALIHRAFHAIPPLTTKDGLVVNAVYGFFAILFKTLKDIKPTHLAVVFDAKGKNFRHELSADYKATRKKQPDELYEQIPITREIVEAFTIPVFQVAGVEADDVIATVAEKMKIQDMETYVVTGDLDALQLVDEQTFVYTMRKGLKDTIIYDRQAVRDRFCFDPEYMVEYKALRGDTSDNIPGVAGIGEKTACNLIKKYKTVEAVYQNLKKITPNRAKTALEKGEDQAILSRELAEMKIDVEIDFDLEATRLTPYNREKVVELFQKYGFKNLLAQLSSLDMMESDIGQANIFSQAKSAKIAASVTDKYQLITTKADLEIILKKILSKNIIAVDTETTGLDCLANKLVGISLAWESGQAVYIPVKHFEKII